MIKHDTKTTFPEPHPNNNYELQLSEAADKQKHATFYDVHISSPLLDMRPQPVRSSEERKSDNFTIRIPLWVRKRLEEIAEKEEMSINQQVKNAIINALEYHDDREEARTIWLEKYVRDWKNEPPHVRNEVANGIGQAFKNTPYAGGVL